MEFRLVTSQRLTKLSKSLWKKYQEKLGVDSNQLYHFIVSFFPHHDFTFSFTDCKDRKRLIPICEDNDLKIFFEMVSSEFNSSLDENSTVLNDSNSLDFTKNVLIFKFSSTGIDLLIYFTKIPQSFGKVKVLKFINGNISLFFLKIIEKYSTELKPIGLLQKLCDTSILENEFLNTLMSSTKDSDKLPKEYFLGIIAILLTCSEFVKLDDFHNQFTRKIQNSPFISVEDFFSFLERFFSSTTNILFHLTRIVEILNDLDNGSFEIDMQSIQSMLNYFPFSNNEPSFTLQEIALTPLLLSTFEETYSNSFQKKKQGKYYTNISDADFIVHLAVFRFLQDQNPLINKKDLFQWVYSSHNVIPIGYQKSVNRIKFTQSALKVLDPSCGSGTFLVCISRLFFYLSKKNSIKEKLVLQLWGFDLAKTALSVTRLRLLFLSLYEITRETSLTKVKETGLALILNFENIHNTDFLFHSINENFDIIIGNPPFVRQEDIGSYAVSNYKDNLIQRIKSITRVPKKIDKKSDLYIYFCLLGLSLLNNGGVLAFLTSNAWLEVKYGQTLQKFLLDDENHFSRFEIIQRSRIRLWQKVGINSVILLCQKSNDDGILDKEVLFTDSKTRFDLIPEMSLFKGIISGESYTDDYYRVERIERKELSQTHKWAGMFLRTKNSERILLKKLGKKGVPLHSLADIKFGIKTGSNDFFHIQIADDSNNQEDSNLVSVKNRLNYIGLIERKYLIPLIKSPTHVKQYIVPHNFSPKYWLFYCHDSPNQLKGSKAWEYIQWGEKIPITIKQGIKTGLQTQGFSSLKSVAQRKNWYSLNKYPVPTMLWTKSYHNKQGCLMNDANVIPDQRFYAIIVNEDIYTPLIFLYLNSSFTWALMEAQGNTNMGYGVLDTNVYWLKDLKIPINALEENTRIIKLMTRLRKEVERIPINTYSSVRNDIDRFFAPYFDFDETSLVSLNQYNLRSINNRLS